MKDWRKSPEVGSMMGGGVVGRGLDDGNVTEESPFYSNQIGSTSQLGSPNQHQNLGSPNTSALRPPHYHHAKEDDHTTQRIRTKVDISLGEMARRVIIQKIHLYQSLGDAPFSIVRPILEQCSATKLWNLEEETPEYIQYTASIWQKHCLRDFKDVQQAWSQGKIDNDSTKFTFWRELYHAKIVQDFEAKEAATARIKEKYAALRADKEANQVRIVTDIPVKNRKFAGSGRSQSSGSTQGQKMLSKARRQAGTHAQSNRTPFRGKESNVVPTMIRPKSISNIASSSKPSANANITSSSREHNPPMSPLKEPPGFERRATFQDAKRLEDEAFNQLSRAMSKPSKQKRDRGDEFEGENVSLGLEEKRARNNAEIDAETFTSIARALDDSNQDSDPRRKTKSPTPTMMSSTASRRPMGAGISVRTKRF